MLTGCSALTTQPAGNNNDDEPTASLQTLPTELLLDINGYLDYGSALSLLRTSRFFHNLALSDEVGKDDKLDYVLAAEGFRHNGKRLACFVCLRLRGEGEFALGSRTGELREFGGNELGRRCRDC